jgi:hypothetical protein
MTPLILGPFFGDAVLPYLPSLVALAPVPRIRDVR